MDTLLYEFVSKHTRSFDETHGIEHALAVYNNAMLIAQTDYPELDMEIIMYASLLHDVRDHKYPESISQVVLEDFVYTAVHFSTANIILAIIDNVSFSKEVKGLRKQIDDETTKYLDIISDADKLEALGEVGIKRCIGFTHMKGGNVPDDVIKHCHDKLLRLYTNGYIKTPSGRKLALPLHKEVERYVLENGHS